MTRVSEEDSPRVSRIALSLRRWEWGSDALCVAGDGGLMRGWGPEPRGAD